MRITVVWMRGEGYDIFHRAIIAWSAFTLTSDVSWSNASYMRCLSTFKRHRSSLALLEHYGNGSTFIVEIEC